VIRLIATDPAVPLDIPVWCHLTGHAYDTFLVCSPCAKKRGITEEHLIEGATIVGGATLVGLLADGAASLSF